MSQKTIAALAASFLSVFMSLGCDQSRSSGFELQNPSSLIHQGLFTLSESNRLRFGGEAVDFGRLMRDGKVDFALVTPSMTRLDLLNFDLSTFISPEFDQIEVVGETIDLPSNISLPQQVENYSIISIRLNKPSFKTFVKSPGVYTFTALHGQFPVRQVVDDFRNDKSVFEILNRFSFLGGGQVEAQVNSSMDGQNISVNQLRFDQEVSVTGPSVDRDQLAFSLSLSEVDGQLSPVDLKRLTPGRTQDLKVSPLGNPFVLSALVEENPQGGMPTFDRMSLTLLPKDFSSQPDFLEYTKAPQHSGQQLKVFPPRLNGSQRPVAVYVSFSEIRKITSGSVDTEERTVLWENWTDGFTSSISTSSLSYVKKPNRVYRWEVLYLAKDLGVPSSGPDVVDQVTHIGRNILEVR